MSIIITIPDPKFFRDGMATGRIDWNYIKFYFTQNIEMLWVK